MGLVRLGWVVGLVAAGGVTFGIFRMMPRPSAPPPPEQPAPVVSFEVRTRALAGALVAAKQNPQNAALALEVGGLAGDLRQYQTALTWFSRAEKLDPRLLPALTGQGQMWMALGRPGLAAKSYERALKLAPREPQLLLELARAHLQLRAFDQALRYAGEAENLAPEDPLVHRALGSIHADLQQMDQAVTHLERSCAVAPGDPENWALLGDVLFKQRRYGEAEKAARQALDLDPGHIASNILLARILLDGKKTAVAEQEAFTILARARVVEPANVQALLLQSQILMRREEVRLAISLLRRAREEAPRDATVLLALGQALVRDGQSEEGLRLSSAGQKLGPRGVAFLDLEDLVAKDHDPALALRLSDLYLRQEMYDSAIYVLERGLQRTPGSDALRKKLAEARSRLDGLVSN